jgi:4-amino-4-deoxy-L-arabinose transferase-like glycosyltransferase
VRIEVSEPTTARPGARRRADGVTRTPGWGRWFLLFLLAAVLLRLPAFFVEVFNSDETFLATQARVLNEGGRLYEDAADRKPPLVPHLYAWTFRFFDTTALWSVRVMAMVAVAVTAALLACEARRRWGDRAGLLAGLLLVCTSVSFAPQDGQAANFEVFMLPAMTAGFVLGARGRPGAAGVSTAVATLAKQTGAATLLPLALLAHRHGGRTGLVRLAVGFALPIAAVAWLVGPSQLAFWAVLGNGSYLGVGTATWYVAGRFGLMTAGFAASVLGIVLVLPDAWRSRRRLGTLDVWLWLASAALSVAVGFRFFGHYYVQLLPPLCLLAAGWLARVGTAIARRVSLGLVVATAVVCTGLGFTVKPWDDAPRYRRVSDYLLEVAGPADRVLVWGQVPEIYWASGTRPATRFVTTGFLTGNFGGRPPNDTSADVPTPGAWSMFLTDLRFHPPRFILDTTVAGIRGSQQYPMRSYPELDRLVRRHYRYRTTVDDIDVYERRPPPTGWGRRIG